MQIEMKLLRDSTPSVSSYKQKTEINIQNVSDKRNCF